VSLVFTSCVRNATQAHLEGLLSLELRLAHDEQEEVPSATPTLRLLPLIQNEDHVRGTRPDVHFDILPLAAQAHGVNIISKVCRDLRLRSRGMQASHPQH
jgi:hypothetical protein